METLERILTLTLLTGIYYFFIFKFTRWVFSRTPADDPTPEDILASDVNNVVADEIAAIQEYLGIEELPLAIQLISHSCKEKFQFIFNEGGRAGYKCPKCGKVIIFNKELSK